MSQLSDACEKCGRKIGFLMADIDIVSFMENILEDGNSLFWQESVILASPEAAWFCSGQEVEDFDQLLKEEDTQLQLLDGRMISINGITQSRDRLIQVIPRKMDGLLYSVGGVLLVIFLLSLVVIYFGVRFISHSIIIPLRGLKDKMTHTIEYKQDEKYQQDEKYKQDEKYQ